jgi:hypothetical protein
VDLEPIVLTTENHLTCTANHGSKAVYHFETFTRLKLISQKFINGRTDLKIIRTAAMGDTRFESYDKFMLGLGYITGFLKNGPYKPVFSILKMANLDRLIFWMKISSVIGFFAQCEL